MKSKRLAKLRHNMWLYFILFALIIIVITWVFQLLVFDIIYQQKRYDAMLHLGSKLSDELNTDSAIDDKVIESWYNLSGKANENGIFTFLAYYENGELVINTIFSGYTSDFIKPGYGNEDGSFDVDVKPPTSPQDPIHEAVASEETITAVKLAVTTLVARDTDFVCERPDNALNNDFFFYATHVKNPSLDGFLVLTSDQVFLQDTIKVIQMQLVIVTIVVVIIAFFLSWVISGKLSKPIVKMSKTAKSWAGGDDEAVFAGDNYEELSELADALNYAKTGISQTGVLQRDLLANVSHDLKTPLTMIKAYAEMIRDLSGDIKDKRDKHTKVIIDEADRLTMLVNDILDLSKLQNDINAPELTVVNLSELCESVLFRFSEFANINGYTIISEVEPDLITKCDKREIEQVFYNLIGNSINYTGDDKTISVRLRRKGEGLILFETIDTGKGISQEKLQTIWDKYYRYSETHQRPVKGTGLGLSIVKTILEAHNLRFGVISKKDVGSNFFIEFLVCDE